MLFFIFHCDINYKKILFQQLFFFLSSIGKQIKLEGK